MFPKELAGAWAFEIVPLPLLSPHGLNLTSRRTTPSTINTTTSLERINLNVTPYTVHDFSFHVKLRTVILKCWYISLLIHTIEHVGVENLPEILGWSTSRSDDGGQKNSATK